MTTHAIKLTLIRSTQSLHMNKTTHIVGTTEDYKKTELYESLNEMEVWETHMGHCCGSHTCKATHVNGGAKWVFGTIYFHTVLL